MPAISPALSAAINAVTDHDLRFKIDILVAKAVGALETSRRIDFTGYEQRELDEHSLQVWNEVAPKFAPIFKELNGVMEAAIELFPRKEKDPLPGGELELEAAFSSLEGGGTSAEAEHNSGELVVDDVEGDVTDLVHSFAWAIKTSITDEYKKLREPTLMQAQWNLLGELEEFRDRTVGALHGMVTAVLGVFEDVELEALFPEANALVEMGVALRHELAELIRSVDAYVAILRTGVDLDTARDCLVDTEERVGRILNLPAMRYLRATDRHQLAQFKRGAAALRTDNATTPRAIQTALDALATFLSSLQAVELKERLKDHDAEVAGEALRTLGKAVSAVHTNRAQALVFLSHAMRRIARLRGLSPQLDATHREMKELSAQGASPAQIAPVAERLIAALKVLQAG